MEDPISLSNCSELSIKDQSPISLTVNSDNDDQDIGEILVVSVEINDGKKDTIKVYENDDPWILASEFAIKHGLDPKLQEALAEHIIKNRALAGEKLGREDLMSVESSLVKHGNSKSCSDLFKIRRKPWQNDCNFKPKVNPRSTKLLAHKQRGEVYDRLFHQRKKTKPTLRQASLSTSSSGRAAAISPKATPSTNYGSLLYLRGMKQKKRRERASGDTTMETFTHKPKIDKVSALLSPRYKVKRENILLEKGAETQRKKETLRRLHSNDDLLGCSFKPQIGKKSNQMARKSFDNSKSHYNTLYETAEKYRESKKQLYIDLTKKECPFRPKTNVPQRNEKVSEFIERLVNEKKKQEEELEKIREAKITTKDTETGQELFKPVISRGPLIERDRSTPLWEQLHEEKQIKMNNTLNVIQERDSLFMTMSSISNISENSLGVYDDYKKKKCRQMFEYINPHASSMLTKDTELRIDDSWPESTKTILAQIQDDLWRGLTMNLFVFTNKMDIYMSKLTVTQRAEILRRAPRRVRTELRSRPSISNVTKELAQKRRGDAGSIAIHERLTAANTKKDEWLEDQMAKKAEEEAKTCSFSPEVHMFAISENEETFAIKKKKEKRKGKNVFDRLMQQPLGWGAALGKK